MTAIWKSVGFSLVYGCALSFLKPQYTNQVLWALSSQEKGWHTSLAIPSPFFCADTEAVGCRQLQNVAMHPEIRYAGLLLYRIMALASGP